MNKVSLAATLVGLETPKSGHNVEIKPYGISGLTTHQPNGAASNTDPDARRRIRRQGRTHGRT